MPSLPLDRFYKPTVSTLSVSLEHLETPASLHGLEVSESTWAEWLDAHEELGSSPVGAQLHADHSKHSATR